MGAAYGIVSRALREIRSMARKISGSLHQL
jgi:hypothetical protein